MQLPSDLVEQIDKGNVALFLGNDAPLGFPAKAPPSRVELATALANRLGEENTSSLPIVAQLFEVRRGRHALVQAVIDLVDNPSYKPCAIHRQIADLPFRAILAAGYDRLLEEALREVGKQYSTVLGGVDTPYVEEDRVMIYYLHGNVTRPDSLVLTSKDQLLLGHKLRVVFDVLRYLFQTRPLLFLNYGLSVEGEELQKLFHEVTYNVDSHRRRAFAVWSAPDADVVSYWRAENLTVLDATTDDFLSNLTYELAQAKKPKVLVDDSVSQIGQLRKPPYKFLDYYDDSDADIFYGRETESVRFWRMILSHRLSVLFGPSGAGKTSLLKAGVMPRLREAGYTPLYLRALDDLGKTIRGEVMRRLQITGRSIPPVSDDRALMDFFHTVLHESDRLVIIIDQFEECFLRLSNLLRQRFWNELASFRDRPDQSGVPRPEVRFVMCLREDYLPYLDEARDFDLELFNSSYRLTNLSEDTASVVITEPAALAGLTVEPDLVKALLSDLSEQDIIAPPQLQIVCDRLYRGCLANEEAVQGGEQPQLIRDRLTLDDYKDLGGAEGILADYVDHALDQLPHTQRSMAEAILKVMVTSQSTKTALTHEEMVTCLAETGLIDPSDPKDQMILQDTRLGLQRARLIRGFQRDHSILYELTHECMATRIGAWMTGGEVVNKLARELLRREMESWNALGKLIERGSLTLIHERRRDLRYLNTKELELLFCSALEAQYEIAYWAKKAADAGVPVFEIALRELKSKDFRQRVGAVVALGQLGERCLEHLVEVLSDRYPQVRVAAIKALVEIGSPEAWHVIKTGLPYECYVPSGEFTMGANVRQQDLPGYGPVSGLDFEVSISEQPARRVYLDTFFIDKHPVTNADYDLFLADNPQHPAPAHWSGRRFPPGTAEHPITNVNWFDANAYAQWAGKRLPTEAEWEKAARGSDGRTFPWGETFKRQCCNTAESMIGKITPVGFFSPVGNSPYGAADIAGNAWEWTHDWYDPIYYSQAPTASNPLGPSDGTEKVLRGGSFRYHHDRATTFSRFSRSPRLRGDDFGFRCAL